MKTALPIATLCLFWFTAVGRAQPTDATQPGPRTTPPKQGAELLKTDILGPDSRVGLE